MGLKFVMYGAARNSGEAGMGAGLYEVYKATANQTIFPLIGSYRPGRYELEVYVNGVRQMLNSDYTETNMNTVTFSSPLDADDEVMFIVREVRRTSMHQEFIAIDGQTDFALSSPYHVGLNTLQVYENGMLLRVGDDYEEVSDTLVRLKEPCLAGIKITFKEIV